MKIRKSIPLLAGLVLLALVITSWLFLSPQQSAADLSVARPSVRGPQAGTQILADFSEWAETYSGSNTTRRAELTPRGLELARERRTSMEKLMRSDPQRALEQAVTLDVWKNLPPALQAEVEEPFSALASVRVLPVCVIGSPDAARIAAGEKFPDATRWTEIPGSPTLETFVFGRRSGLGSKDQSPVQGIRLGTLAALREEIFHPLAPEEISMAESIYPLANPSADLDFSTGLPLGADPVITLAGGKIFKFAGPESLDQLSKAMEKLDEKPGPHTGPSVLFLPKGATGSAAGFNLPEAIALNEQLASAWTETKKKVFIIRCDLSDKPNTTAPVVDPSTYSAMLNTTASDTIRSYSYGKTWIEATVSTDITRLPQASTYYAADVGGGTSRNSEILSDGKSVYQAAHPTFVPSNYDIIGVWFTSIGMKGSGLTYAGLASVGGGDLWIQGTSDAVVHVHEFGHNYGIGHSSFWKPSVGSTNPVDPSGTYEEYGDVFDVMGDGTVPEGAFHSQAKQRLNWLATGEWTDATAGGNTTYRIYRIDNATTTGVRGLRVTKATGEYYWLNYRRAYSNNWLKAGTNIVWQRSGETRSWLIDTTPGSIAGADDRTDGSLAIGRTYSDGNTNITTLARGGVPPQEYLDIRVNTGPFPGNVAPTASIAGPSAIAARQTCIFTAQGTDADEDELAYSWDFGQGFTFDNHSTASYAWTSGGTYTVKVTVSDMKGHTTQATKTVTVSDPINTWAARTNSSGGDFKALAANSTKVIAVGEDYTLFKGPVATSADGITWSSHQLGSNQQMAAATSDGGGFLLAGQDYDFGISAFVGCILTSPSGNAGSWTRRVYSGPPLNGIAYGGGVYVAVGENGTILRSTDSITWAPVSSGTSSYLSSVSYGGGKFVIVGRQVFNTSGNGIVLTSGDGSSWTNTTAGAGLLSWHDLRHITWAGDRFITSGYYSKIRQSLDLGATFTTTRTSGAEDAAGVAYGNGVWFAAGIDWSTTNDDDIDLVSSDGANWNPLTTPALDDRNAAIFFNNTFITAGDNHSIRQSGTILPSANGYYTWRETYFPDHGPFTAPNEDADTDSVSNLMEYALTRSPVTGSSLNGAASLPQAVIVSSEPLLNDRIALQIDMPQPAAQDLTYIVEASSNLAGGWSPIATKVGGGTWTWNGGGTSRIVTGTASGGRVLVKIGDSQPISTAPTRFLRLRAQVHQ